MAIKAVLFDLDNTLFDSYGLTRKARLEACEAMVNAGLPAKSAEEVYGKLKEIVEQYGSNYSKHYNILCKAYGIPRNPEIVMSGRIAYHNTKFALINPFPDTDDVLLQLVKKGVKLAIVTNGLLDKQWEKVLRLKIRHFFESIVVSGKQDTKSGKQSLIKHCLRELKVKPKEAAFVGDKLKTDILSANALGLTTVWFIASGRKAAEKPGKKLEIPDHTIHRMTDLPKVLGF